MSNKKLIDEYPLLVLPSLAVCIGLNEAIILQQINYWLETYKRANNKAHYRDEKWWVYNSKSEWRSNFPWWSESTIWRGLNRLRELGLVNVTSKYNKMGYDRTLWYTIDYSAVDSLPPFSQNEQMDNVNLGKPFSQNEQMDNVNLGKPIPETTNEIINEINHENTIPAQQNSNASDNLNLEPLPDDDISFPENTTTSKSSTKTGKATEGATDGLTTSQQDKSCLNDYFPREDPVETQPTGKHSAAEVRESSAAALRNYAQRNSAEPWREWFPGTVKDVNGIPAYELQKVGHTLCSVTGWQPDPRMVRAWLPELARLYDLAGGKVKYIQSATEEVWQREPQYRPKSPHGLAQPVMDYRARSKPPSPDEQRKLWNLGGR